ncbi:MAG: hypothetical protein Q4G71_11905 [Pseudomonadota bacterium]|nr:hypothetical protein [Pseudomonadota bacterium]
MSRAPCLPALLLACWLALGCDAAPKPAAAAHTPTATPAALRASAGLPPALQGEWAPVSAALQGLGALTLGAHQLRWSICGGGDWPFQLPDGDTASAPRGQVLVALADSAACRLDADAVTHLRLGPVPEQPCQMQVSLYTSAALLARNERLAWGIYERQGCTQSTRKQ